MKLYEKNNINLGTVFFNYWAVHLLELDTNINLGTVFFNYWAVHLLELDTNNC